MTWHNYHDRIGKFERKFLAENVQKGYKMFIANIRSIRKSWLAWKMFQRWANCVFVVACITCKYDVIYMLFAWTRKSGTWKVGTFQEEKVVRKYRACKRALAIRVAARFAKLETEKHTTELNSNVGRINSRVWTSKGRFASDGCKDVYSTEKPRSHSLNFHIYLYFRQSFLIFSNFFNVVKEFIRRRTDESIGTLVESFYECTYYTCYTKQFEILLPS